MSEHIAFIAQDTFPRGSKPITKTLGIFMLMGVGLLFLVCTLLLGVSAIGTDRCLPSSCLPERSCRPKPSLFWQFVLPSHRLDLFKDHSSQHPSYVIR